MTIEKELYDEAVEGLTVDQVRYAASSFVGKNVTAPADDIEGIVLNHADIEGGMGAFLDECWHIKNPAGCGCTNHEEHEHD